MATDAPLITGPNPPWTEEEWLQQAANIQDIALRIFDPHLDLNTMTQGEATGLKAPSTSMDGLLYRTILPIAQAVDNRTPAPGFKYTLNVTNALQLRPKKWYIHYMAEYDNASLFPAAASLALMPWGSGGVYNGVNSFGYSLGLAMCATIAQAWAAICRMSSQGNYYPADAGGYVHRVST